MCCPSQLYQMGPLMSMFANNALLVGGVRVRVWIREQRKRSKALATMPLIANLDITQWIGQLLRRATVQSRGSSTANLSKFLLVFLRSQSLKASSCVPHKPTSQSFFLCSSQANLSKLLLVFLTSRPLEASSCVPHKPTSQSYFLCSSQADLSKLLLVFLFVYMTYMYLVTW